MFSLPEITLCSELNVLSDDESLIRELFLPDKIEQKERVALLPLPDIITSLESIRRPFVPNKAFDIDEARLSLCTLLPAPLTIEL